MASTYIDSLRASASAPFNYLVKHGYPASSMLISHANHRTNRILVLVQGILLYSMPYINHTAHVHIEQPSFQLPRSSPHHIHINLERLVALQHIQEQPFQLQLIKMLAIYGAILTRSPSLGTSAEIIKFM